MSTDPDQRVWLDDPRAQAVVDVYDALAQGELVEVVGRLDDRVVWTMPSGLGAPLSGRHQGSVAVLREVVTPLHDEWRELRYEPEEAVVAGDRVVVAGRTSFRSADSGDASRVETRFVHDWHVVDGLVVAIDAYEDTAVLMANRIARSD